MEDIQKLFMGGGGSFFQGGAACRDQNSRISEIFIKANLLRCRTETKSPLTLTPCK